MQYPCFDHITCSDCFPFHSASDFPRFLFFFGMFSSANNSLINNFWSVKIAVYQQLQEYEQKVFGLAENSLPTLPIFPPVGPPSFSFGFPKTGDPVPTTPFNSIGATSIFSRPTMDVPSHEFTFGAGQTQNGFSASPFGTNPRNSTSSNIQMDSA